MTRFRFAAIHVLLVAAACALAGGAHAIAPRAAADALAVPAPTRVALGGTHCWWACYPGSGCQYICQFHPQ